MESGRYRDITDLRGMRFAMNAPGVSNTSTLNTLLKSVGLRYADVDTINLPFPDHVVALKNKSVDAAASVEPAPTIAITGEGVRLAGRLRALPDDDPSGWKFQLHDARVLCRQRAPDVRFTRRNALRTLAWAAAATQQACTSTPTHLLATPAAASAR